MFGAADYITKILSSFFVIFRVSSQSKINITLGTLTAFPNHNGFHLGNLSIMDVYQMCRGGNEFLCNQSQLASILRRSIYIYIYIYTHIYMKKRRVYSLLLDLPTTAFKEI